MKYLIATVFLVFVESCGFIQINENDYRSLSDYDKRYIKPFDSKIVTTKVNNIDSLFIYEINSDNIKEVTKEHAYTWIHLWRPFCHADVCQNINYLTNITDNFASEGLALLLISVTYGFKDIENVVKNSRFEKPVFVLQNNYYGYKMRKNRVKLVTDLKPELASSKKIWSDDYFYKDTTLIYAGSIEDKNKIDSLMQVNNNTTRTGNTNKSY